MYGIYSLLLQLLPDPTPSLFTQLHVLKKKILTSICAARKEEKLNTDSFAFVGRDQTNTKLQILLAWLIAGTYPSSGCS